MKRRITMAGVLAGVLSGCNEQEVGLSFQVSVIDPYTYGHVDVYYDEAVRSLLAEQQIDPAQVQLWADEDNPWVVNLRLPGDTLTPVRREALQATVDAVQAARQAVTGNVTLTLADRPDEPIALRLAFPNDIAIKSDTTLSEALRSLTENTARARVDCRVPVRLRANLPFEVLDYRQGVMTLRTPDQKLRRTPVRLEFADGGLRNQVGRGQVTVSFSRDKDRDHMIFELGSLGMQSWTPMSARDSSLNEIYGLCRSRATQLGRPLSLFVGNGLDRLTYLYLPPAD
ncbi:hypothetical protein [Pseudomonas aegrilactucae]|uniref:Lipoprotein n=1 Tax=Pseudomonas aegrilactucae TaxID=2854028 RepID=A0A9Q2XM29_9PSED|nr:hypothetical protein [Pseudomonas aegrilactucae]MBV6288659.1 hypothetical protein [Pseudomonas aegrilactucae]